MPVLRRNLIALILAKVRVLIQTARDYAFGFDGGMDERDGDGPGAATISGSGKGGIPSRTSIQGPPAGYRLILD